MTDSNHPGSSSQPQRPTAPSGAEYQDVLSGVLHDAEERKAAGMAAAKRQRDKVKGKGNQPLMLGVLALVSGYLWFGQPSFLEPVPLDPISAELSEASLRMEMATHIGKITQFQRQNDRLPDSLAEAWEARPGFVYQTRSDGFTLVGNERDATLQYDSSQDVFEFLGDARRVIDQGGTQ